MPPFPTWKFIENRLEIHAKNHPNYCCSPEPFWVSFWKPKSSSKRDRNHAKTTLFSQKASKMPPEASKMLRDGSKRLPKRPKIPPKSSKACPKSFQETLKRLQKASKQLKQRPKLWQFVPIWNWRFTVRIWQCRCHTSHLILYNFLHFTTRNSQHVVRIPQLMFHRYANNWFHGWKNQKCYANKQNARGCTNWTVVQESISAQMLPLIAYQQGKQIPIP